MRNIVKTALLLMLFSLVISCGKKGALYYEGERKQPNFDQMSDEMEEKPAVKEESAEEEKPADQKEMVN